MSLDISAMEVAYLVAACDGTCLKPRAGDEAVKSLFARGLIDSDYKPTANGRQAGAVVKTVGQRELARFSDHGGK